MDYIKCFDDVKIIKNISRLFGTDVMINILSFCTSDERKKICEKANHCLETKYKYTGKNISVVSSSTPVTSYIIPPPVTFFISSVIPFCPIISYQNRKGKTQLKIKKSKTKAFKLYRNKYSVRDVEFEEEFEESESELADLKSYTDSSYWSEYLF
jgi:hypothetical protein